MSPREFTVKDLVLRRTIDNKKETNSGKLGATWEGLYIVDVMVGKLLTDWKTQMVKRLWGHETLCTSRSIINNEEILRETWGQSYFEVKFLMHDLIDHLKFYCVQGSVLNR